MEFTVKSRNETHDGKKPVWNVNATNDTSGAQLNLSALSEAEASKYKPGSVIKLA